MRPASRVPRPVIPNSARYNSHLAGRSEGDAGNRAPAPNDVHCVSRIARGRVSHQVTDYVGCEKARLVVVPQWHDPEGLDSVAAMNDEAIFNAHGS
jgi:hypothetical protein